MDDNSRRQDDILIGKLIQAVDTLTKEVETLRKEVGELKTNAAKGKGFVFGILLAAGGAGAAITQAVHSLFK